MHEQAFHSEQEDQDDNCLVREPDLTSASGGIDAKVHPHGKVEVISNKMRVRDSLHGNRTARTFDRLCQDT